MSTLKVISSASRYGQRVTIRQFELAVDEPPTLGGDDGGPTPSELVVAGLGSCKAITLKMYAERKGWPLEDVQVDLSYRMQDKHFVITAELTLIGSLDEAQRQRLLAISDRCPVHRLLTASASIETRLAD